MSSSKQRVLKTTINTYENYSNSSIVNSIRVRYGRQNASKSNIGIYKMGQVCTNMYARGINVTSILPTLETDSKIRLLPYRTKTRPHCHDNVICTLIGLSFPTLSGFKSPLRIEKLLTKTSSDSARVQTTVRIHIRSP